MFTLYADKNRMIVRKKEPVTSGSVNVCPVKFEFSNEWHGLAKTAVFRAGGKSAGLILDETGACSVPWEVLEKPGLTLYAGVYGTRGADTVLPTIWAGIGQIQEGVTIAEAARPPAPGAYEQVLAALEDKADGILLDGPELQLLSGDYPLSSVILPTGGGEGGVSDHRQLAGRDAANQHPMDAISGLSEAIPRPMTAEELRKILMGG